MANAVFNLSSLYGANGFVLNGITAGDQSGHAVAAAGDVNGDGFGDVIVGARFANPNGQSSAGESYVVFGTAEGFAASLNLSSLNGTNGFVLNGIDAFGQSGSSVASAGDVNGDGIGDLVVGAFGAASDAGESYVVFGTTAGFAASLELSALNGTNGFVLNGIDNGDFSGRSVASAGDVNGDGIGDLIIGADLADANGVYSAGETYVVFGTTAGFAASLDLSSLNGANGFVINGIDQYDSSGYSVASAGDVNGDGIGDLIIGADFADPNGVGDAGETYVVFGTTAGFAASLDLSSLDGTNGFVLNGVDLSDRSGSTVASAGDVNGDGIDDLIIGAGSADSNGDDYAGETYVVFGTTAGFGASLNLSSLDGTNGFVLNGIDGNDRSGDSVASAGDVNGDGIGDLIIGARGADPNGALYAGESYVVFGTTAGFGASLNLSSLDGTNGFVINGIDTGEGSGGSVASAGDVNGDGVDDLIIGASGADPNGQAAAGESYVIFGSTAFGATINATAGTDSLTGNDADNFIAGLNGNDTIRGLGGADTLIGGLGLDALDGGAGFDIADYTDKAGGVNVNLFNGTAITGGAINASGVYAGGAVEDTLVSIEGVFGSNSGDRLVASNSAARLDGRGGNDFLIGGNGNDTLIGGDGADSVHGGAGNDSITGGSSPDTINGGLGFDTLDGGTGLDTIDYSDRAGGVNVNVINGVALTGGFINASGFYQGGAQEDTISNFENIFGSNFADRLVAGSTSARIEGRGGNDFLFTFSGNDTLFGGEGNDSLSTANSTDRLFGENGNDTLNGGTGLDTLDGGANTDTADYADRTGGVNVNLFNGAAITGGALNASGFYSGGFTEDSLVSIESAIGSNFGDRLVASLASGRLDGRGGNDNLSGLDGADTLIGGAGNDTLSGGAGSDIFEFASGFGADRITDFAEGAGAGDVIRLVGLGAAFDSFAEVIAAASQSGADVVFNLGGGNTITVANAAVAGFAADDFTFG